MDQIPRDIDLAVRTAAETTQGYAGELPDVYRRARRRARRRAVAATAGAFTVLAGLVGGGLVLHNRTDATPIHQPDAPAESGQRLLLSHADGEYVAGASSPVRLGPATPVGELLPDGRLVTHPVVGDVFELPDGGLVALGPDELLTVQPSGGDRQQRAVPGAGGPVTLAGADATTAYLWRPYGLYAHDLAGGLERLVISSDMLSLPGDDPAGDLDAADLTPERLVLADARRSCRPELVSLAPPQGLRDLPLTALGCDKVTSLRLSPNTGRVGVSYQKADRSHHVAVLSTEDGTVLARRSVTGPAELAWLTERDLRVVPVPTGGLHELRQFTLPS
ncbi:hypothetical protein M1L60_07095 [Actinoplanes sp. TRM 88003]|uniref:Uncharacterized protein n=1 Tax=Paractinoplanes aksuensis TaxID=2939490 RepID=A0ABT1DHP4_9ACTN|nr:hypothetical protein [Actinoplanes aksuensis]MCO8270361.1 hypothetical protein [Actinoplanes aksuensis]